ncbi:MAG: hypothetical protein ACK5BY_09035 [Limnohabitans sp.]|jgi:hypothetical protein|uniref:hypothetical protein n=1 Tax=Limnohabitans sp. TaxID=1907725 RepID=UPI00391B894E
MSFKVLQKDITGRIQIYRFSGFYRLTSNRQAVVTGMDLEQGLDEFLPVTVSDAEFGTAIRRCHDATRFVDWRTLPKGEAARAWGREWDKLYVLWEQRALEVTGCKTLKELYADASHAGSTRTKELYAFLISEIKKGAFYPVLDHEPEYQELIVPQPASDEAIGRAARAALDALVRSS